MVDSRNILFIATSLSPFVREDLALLEEAHWVRVELFRPAPRWRLMVSLLRQFFFLLFRIRRFDAVYIWFADYHSFLPVLFARWARIPAYVVVGGYDVCRIRREKYGSFVNPVRGYCARYTLERATLDLCVSRHVQRKVRAIAPEAHTRVVYNGIAIPAEGKAPLRYGEKKPRVLTVGKIDSLRRVRLKGIDRFIRTAERLPEYEFVIAGMDPRVAAACGPFPPNLRVYGFLSAEELAPLYRESRVYAQFSRTESFCLTLAEAMYYGCVPVVTGVGGMPEVVGDSGPVVAPGASEAVLAEAVRQAMDLDSGEYARQRVRTLFLSAQRKEALQKAKVI